MYYVKKNYIYNLEINICSENLIYSKRYPYKPEKKTMN